MNNTRFRNFLFNKLKVNDPSINIILNIEKLYNQKIKQKKDFINKRLRLIDSPDYKRNILSKKQRSHKSALNRLNTSIRENTNYLANVQNETEKTAIIYNINRKEREKKNILKTLHEQQKIINEQMREEKNILYQQLKSVSLYYNFGLTFEEEKRYYIIQAINKYYNLLQQLLDFNNTQTTEQKIKQIKNFERNINSKSNIKLPTKEERKILTSNYNHPDILANKKRKFAYYKSKFLDKLRNQKYPLFLDLKRGHLKYNIKKYTIFDLFPISQNKNNINQNLKNNIEKINDNNDIFIKFGINKLVFDKKQLENDNIEENNLIKTLIFWIKQIFLPIKINLNEQIDTDIYLTYNDIVLFNIQFCLLYLKNDIHSREGSEEMTRGAWGAPFSKGEHVFKHEHLRHYESLNFSQRRLYPYYNYQMAVYFIGYIIQNYCNYYFESIIPRTYKITYNLLKNIAETNMNRANINKPNYISCNLNQFFRKPCIYKRDDLLDLFKNILKRICEILIPMQEKIGFVHRDFHPGNIVIIYKYKSKINGSNIIIKENNNVKNDLIIDFDLKIIDFTFSSILINNEKEEVCLFKYTNWQVYRLPYLLDPLESNLYKCYDLIFFILRILFNTFLIHNDHYNLDLYNHYHNIIEYLVSIFAIKPEFNNVFMQTFRDARRVNIYTLLQNKELFINILGNEMNLNLFNPTNLIESIDI